MRTFYRTICLALCLACASHVAAKEPKASCPDPEMTLLWFEERDAAPGETVKLSAMSTDGPGSFEDVPAKCLGKWTSSNPAVAAIARDQASVTIADDAAPGSVVVLSAKIGKGEVTGKVRIYRRDLQALVGIWAQRDADCPGGNPIRELKFSAKGSFSVTQSPFETYRDYWGDWDYDAATRQLTLTVTGGNDIPPDIDPQGSALVDGGRLSFDGLYLGSLGRGDRQPTCTAAFVR